MHVQFGQPTARSGQSKQPFVGQSGNPDALYRGASVVV
jgi:hypothetical protein